MIIPRQIRGVRGTKPRELREAIRDLEAQARQSGRTHDLSGFPTVQNDSGGFIVEGMIYGRGSDGRLTLAGGSVRPELMAMAEAGDGDFFPYAAFAQGARAFVPGDLGEFGAIAFVDTANPGCVTFTAPTSPRWVVGVLADDVKDDDGRAKISLSIQLQGVK